VVVFLNGEFSNHLLQGKEELEHMVNEVMENLDTFVLEPAPQVRRGWRTWPTRSWRTSTHLSSNHLLQGKEELEHMVNEVMENLDTFVLEPAPQVGKSWSAWSRRS
jgi:hypothetical protein